MKYQNAPTTNTPRNPRAPRHARTLGAPRADVHGASPAARGRSASARDAGSLLILCVTVLVIIALIGIAYLQRVRMDQFATARHERSFTNLVINGVLDEVVNQMETDVNANQSAGNPLFDYPWTNHDIQEFEVTREFPLTPNVPVNGYRNTGNNQPAPQDDRWFSSTAPVWNPNGFGGGAYHWMHLTNLTGIRLDLPDGSTNVGAIEYLIDGDIPQIGNAAESNTDLSLSRDPTGGLQFRRPGGYETRGTDADADGIIDAIWQWTPVSVRNLGGKKYVMALRVVDLNAMLNVNTAASLTYNGDAGTPVVARGYNPSWVDLSRLFERTRPAYYNQPRDWKDELTEIVALRISNTTLPSTDFNVGGAAIFESTNQGEVMWEQQGSVHGNTDRNYLMDSELELRRFGGLNDRSLTSTLEVNMGQTNTASYAAGEKLSRVLRQHPDISDDSGLIGAEGSYLDVVNPAGSLSEEQSINRWFYGDDGTPTTDGDSLRVRDREFPAVRHMLTAASGTASYSVTPSPATFATGRLKFELNRDWDDDLATLTIDFGKLSDHFESAFKRASGNYLNLPDGQIDNMIDEYVVSIKDYSDADSVPTEHPAVPGLYGMERLPFLREVYVQALYVEVEGDSMDRAPWDPANDGSAGTNYVGWSPDISDVGGNTYAMAIEIGNPFNHVIYGVDPNTGDSHTQGLDGQVEVRVLQGGTLIGSHLFDPTTPDIEPRNDSGNDDTLILYSPPIDAIADYNGTIDGDDLDNDLNMPADAQVLRLNPGDLTDLNAGFNPGGGDIEVQMWVRVSTGGFELYDRMVLDADASLPSNVDRATPVANTSPAQDQFAQASSARDSQNINYVVDDGQGGSDINITLPRDNGTFDTGADRFGNDNKGTGIAVVVDAAFYDKLQLHLTDQPMRSLAELGLVHMFGFTSTETFSERMSASYSPLPEEGEHFLLVNPDQRGYEVMPGVGLPHVAQLMDVVTTISPLENGKDNDNDDGDNNRDTVEPTGPAEFFTPGMINVNTAPLHIMTLGSPLGEGLDAAESLMRTIVAYRDEPLRGPRLRPGRNHGDYWSAGVAGFDVRDARNPLNQYHVRDYPNVRLDQPGIASLGELLSLNPGTPDNDMLREGIDGTPGLPTGNGGLDMHPDRDDLADANSPVVPDDNEQLLARFGMLSQAYSVRSDRFVVYGVLRGYDNPDLRGLPSETARFIAVIDRGAMETAGTDKPRVIGFVRLQ